MPVGAVGDVPDGVVKQWDWPFAQAAARVLAYGFVAWECPAEESLSRIRAVYVDRFDDESAWDWFCLLELTRSGTVLARTIEAQTQR